MKKIVLLVLATLVPLTARAWQSGNVPGTPVGFDEEEDLMLAYSRFWSYYDPYPSNFIGSREWWGGNALTGDWWGVRNYLDDSGVTTSLSYTNNIAGNPVGGRSQAVAYADNLSVGIQFDLETLIGWNGLTLTTSALDRNGSNLSARDIGNQFTVQQVYGTQTIVFFALALEQSILDDKMSIKIGRFATGDDFASSPLYWLYMNNGIDGNPQALPVNTGFSAYPAATWGARLRVDPTPDVFTMAGIYQVTDPDLHQSHGLNWSMRRNDGVFMIAQIGWTPEFFKHSVPTNSAPSDAKAVATTKPLSEGKTHHLVEDIDNRGLPGHYWFGAYFSPAEYSQFGSNDSTSNSYGFYWHADQMIWQETPGSDQGLTLWSAFVLSPQQNIAKLPFQANAGIVYRGLIPTRNKDVTMLGLVYGNFSDDYANTIAATGNGSPTYEIALEAGYRFQFNKFAYVQPNLQWIINPGGTGNIPNALVLGAQVSVTF
jgi:porin